MLSGVCGSCIALVHSDGVRVLRLNGGRMYLRTDWKVFYIVFPEGVDLDADRQLS